MWKTLTRWALAIGGLLLVAQVLGCKTDGVKIEQVDPPFGNVAGDDDVVIVGQGFKPGVVVQFRKRKATKIVLESDKKIRVKTPPGPEGPVDVIVIQPSGKSFMLENGFTYRKEST